MEWQFDPFSALIGAGFALLLVGLFYLWREPLMLGWQRVAQAARAAFGRALAGMESRYRERVIRWAQTTHALADLGPLEQYFVPRHLSLPLPFPDPEQDLPSHPLLLSPADALRGHPRILVVGGPASGRTTLLAYLALTHVRGGADSRIPLYLYLPALDWTPTSEEKKARTPIQRLVQGALEAVGAPATAAPSLRQALLAGIGLVLADGWDELGPAAQEQATAWLADLADALPGNLWVVAVGAQGYAPLTRVGFVPLHLQPWDSPEIRDFLTRLPTPDTFSLNRAAEDLRWVLKRTGSLLDVAFGARSLLENGAVPSRRIDLFRRYLEKWASGLSTSSEIEGAEPVLPLDILRALARKLQEEGRFVLLRAEVEEFIRQKLLLHVASALPEEVPLPTSSPPQEAGTSAPPPERPPTPQPKQLRSALMSLIKALLSPGGPLVACAPGRYRFAHPLWQAMLTAEDLLSEPAALVAHIDNPSWLPVVDFYAESGPMEPVVRAWLSRPDDLWQARLRIAARWASLAPSDAPWRNGIMALLGRSMLAPGLSEESLQRLAEALVWTGDPGVPIFLRHALRNPNPIVRAIATRMMAALREGADLSGLIKALEDPEEVVRIAAAHALGIIGVPAAVESLIHVLTSGDETLQVEAARALAWRGEDGHRVLREALQSDDFMVRRAAAYGLGEIEAIWAREMLEKTAREDPQWIVRSAAAMVLSEREEKAKPAPPPAPPVPSDMGWLIAWAAEQGEGVGLGEAAFGPLLRALAEGPAPIRRAAAQTLGWVGRPEHMDALRHALQDPEPEVARMALRALEELSARYGLTVPA